jgi:hypothetical protein
VAGGLCLAQPASVPDLLLRNRRRFAGHSQGRGCGPPATLGRSTREAMPVELSSFNIDSDAAYQTAATDAAGWLKKNPDKQPSSFQLGNTYRFQAPVWYLVWGDQKSGYVAYVDANTGKVLNKK